ncbi:hypothetical protein [Nocardia mexicana]|uniref:DoxX-like protein n=1 Tax=Nocardia mexicana TaxID=279262 RepID=A0A370GXM8_9NOCA|nr:hypothetical protein [Nocardia mexicana]RDI48445.1 hypothetical protein DFR68_108278 [Nocardia mexicana]
MNRFVTVVTLITAASMIGIGAWCRIDPGSFAQWANWPDHEHFLHDAGVFQIGIGLTMIAALLWRDVIAVVLGGFLIANTLHAYNHAVDHGGGHDSDPWSLLAFSALAVAALLVRLRVLRRRTVPTAVVSKV